MLRGVSLSVTADAIISSLFFFFMKMQNNFFFNKVQKSFKSHLEIISTAIKGAGSSWHHGSPIKCPPETFPPRLHAEHSVYTNKCIYFQILNMIVLTDFLIIGNHTEFSLVRRWKENCQHDHIPSPGVNLLS